MGTLAGCELCKPSECPRTVGGCQQAGSGQPRLTALCLLQRLAIAKEFGDKAAERRAYSNLGNAHIFLGRFDISAEYYK